MRDIRKNYHKASLDLADLAKDPMILFDQWWQEALENELAEPNAMTLATVNAEGHPSARIVLLKGASAEGFEFFTNYQSAKAEQITHQPYVALCFLWKELERQIRIEGIAEKLSFEESQTYFQSRPRNSQIGAWASPQSKVIKDRNELDERVENISEQFENVDPLPCPEHWGGYIVRPLMIEFWQGRPDRMHDRFRYHRKEKGADWLINRLAP